MQNISVEQAKLTKEIRQLVKDWMSKNGGYESTASKIGVNAHTLWNQLNRSDSMQVDMAIKLSSLIPRILDLICEARGYIAIPKEKANQVNPDFKEIQRLLAVLEGELLTEIEKDISPDSLGGEDLVRLEKRRIRFKALNLAREIRGLMLLVEE